MAMSKEAREFVDKKFPDLRDRRLFLKAKNLFNRLPSWTEKEKQQYQTIESTKRAVKETESHKSGERSLLVRNRRYKNLLPIMEYSCKALGFSSPVTDQGFSRTCWAHAICNSLESQVRKLPDLQSGDRGLMFSRRQLIETRDLLNTYMHGDSMMQIAARIKEMGGILRDKDFPKTIHKDGKYKLTPNDRKKIRFTIGEVKTFHNIERKQLQQLIMDYGQLPVTINQEDCNLIGKDTLQLAYKRSYNNKPSLHAVVLDGWQIINGIAFWNLKNSAGKHYLNDGYMLLPMEHDGWMRRTIRFGILKRV